MAVNMYSGWWSSSSACWSPSGQPLHEAKPESELRNLVYGLTPRPEEGPALVREAGAVGDGVTVVLIAVNVIFW